MARQGSCKTVEAVVTTPERLKAKCVILTVGQVWNGGHKSDVRIEMVITIIKHVDKVNGTRSYTLATEYVPCSKYDIDKVRIDKFAKTIEQFERDYSNDNAYLKYTVESLRPRHQKLQSQINNSNHD